MGVFKKILMAVVLIAVIYFAPQLAPQIGQFLGASGFLATAIGSIIITAGLYIVQSILMPRPQAPSMDAGKVNVKIAEPIRWINSGICRQGGGVLFCEFDNDGNLWFLVVHSDSILVEKIQYYLDDIPVTLDGSGNVLTKDFRLTTKNKNPAESDGQGTAYVQIWTTTYTESNPTPPAISALAAAFPSKWTSDHKLVGTTYSVVKMGSLKIEDRYKIYKWRGAIGLGEPALTIVGKWSHGFDPRDETQTNGVPTTYKYMEGNPILTWAWFRTHRYGRNKMRGTINWDRIAEQAAICDQDVVGIAGTTKRYKCHISIPESLQRSDAEQQIMITCDGQLVYDEDGKVWLRAGYYELPTLYLTANRDIVAMESVEAVNGESETQGVIVRYMDPDADYTPQPSAPWYNPLYYSPGESNSFLTVDVLACQDHNQAMRLAKAIGMRSQPLHKIAPTMGLRGIRARHERIININYDNTFAGDYEIVTPVELDDAGYFTNAGMVPVLPDRWTLLPGEEKPKPVIDDSSEGAATAIPFPSGVVITYNNHQISATFDAYGRADYYAQFQYIRQADLASDLWIDMLVNMDQLSASSGTVADGTPYYVRWRTLSGSGRTSDWIDPPYSLGANVTPMLPPENPSATGGAGSAALSWRNPADIRFNFVRIYRSTVNDFSLATAIGDVAGSPSQIMNVTDDDGGSMLAPDTYYWWFVAYDNTVSIVSTPAGPVSATVT